MLFDVDWVTIAPDFEVDGAGRDILIPGADREAWRRVWSVLRAWEPAAVVTREGKPVRLPPEIDAIFDSDRAAGDHVVLVRVGRIGMRGHVFDADEMEFTFDPAEVFGPGDWADLKDFMKRLGDAAKRDVVFAHEDGLEAEVARYEARTGWFRSKAPQVV